VLSMATSLLPVPIPPNTRVDLYDATGILVGNQLIVQNIGSSEAELTESAAEPDDAAGFNSLVPREFFTNSAANVGAWAFSKLGTILQVEES